MVPDKYIVTASDREAVRQGCTFDTDAAERAVRFIETYAVPSTLGKPIKLIPWQRSFVERLYGWRLPSGTRRHKKAILSTAKKNGKTLLQSGILLYEMLGTGTAAPFCVSASTTRENAGQLYRELAFSIRHNPKLARLCKCLDSGKEVRNKDKNRPAFRYKAFSADAGAAEGENISALVVDELHAHVSDKLYRSLEYATIARPDGLVIVISTAGSDPSSLWADLFKYAQGVQAGDIVDTSLLPLVYSAPADADVDSPQTWYAANPSLGVSFSEDAFRRDLEAAKREGTAALLSWRRYRANSWVRADDSYLDPAVWDRCCGPVSEDVLRAAPLYVGVDLASTTDPCSVSCVWVLPNRRYYVRNHAWVCEDGVRRREQTNLPRYQTYAADGVLTVTKGSSADYWAVRSHVQDLAARYDVRAVVFDMHNAIEMTNELQAGGLRVERQSQYHRYYTAPVKEFELAVKEGRVSHDGNKMLRWALANTKLSVNADGDCKPDRGRSTDKIDPCVSTLMAFGRAVTEGSAAVPQVECVYNSRPMAWI